MTTALSSGCFIGHEDRIESAALDAIELSTHSADRLPDVLRAFRRARTRILSIHTPCPNLGRGLDPGAAPESWPWTKRGLLEAGEIALAAGASYVLTHAFFCETAELPVADLDRMIALRRRREPLPSMREYVRSEAYVAARDRTVGNLKSLLPEWRRRFPAQKLILENLNPRHGYGGIVFQDVVDVALDLDGEVGICLDVGHLALAEAALGADMTESVAAARDLIWSVHVHQNFGGRFCIDRHWQDTAARPPLQDVDTHLPVDVRMWHVPSPIEVGRENAAFDGLLEGAVQYARTEGARAVVGSVDVDGLLRLVSPEAKLVLELDARYVPLDDVLGNYARFASAHRTPRREAV
ncbi:MAG: sugar phosphate isomerase/epimerase family protein [Thermoanaerobaculia bacterium]